MGRSCHRDSAPSTAWSAASNTDEELISVLLVCIIFFHFCFIPRGADSISSSSEAQKMEMLEDLCRIPGLLFVLSGNPEDNKSFPSTELDWRSNNCPEQEHQDKNFCEIASRIPNVWPLAQLSPYRRMQSRYDECTRFSRDFWSSSEYFIRHRSDFRKFTYHPWHREHLSHLSPTFFKSQKEQMRARKFLPGSQKDENR